MRRGMQFLSTEQLQKYYDIIIDLSSSKDELLKAVKIIKTFSNSGTHNSVNNFHLGLGYYRLDYLKKSKYYFSRVFKSSQCTTDESEYYNDAQEYLEIINSELEKKAVVQAEISQPETLLLTQKLSASSSVDVMSQRMHAISLAPQGQVKVEDIASSSSSPILHTEPAPNISAKQISPVSSSFFDELQKSRLKHSISYDIEKWGCKPSAKPMSAQRPTSLTREIIKDRCNKILQHVELDAFFYNIYEDFDFEDNTKWRTYIYLRKCVLDYRAKLPHEELTLLLCFLEQTEDNKWLAKRILDESVHGPGEIWGSGMHEWLPRCNIYEVLRRSAGMIPWIEPGVHHGCLWPELDWLYVQAICRSRVKYLFFKTHDNSIESGHAGAVKTEKQLHNKGFCTKGSKHFHDQLDEAFFQSKTIMSFIDKIFNIFKLALIDGNCHLHPSAPKVLIDGTRTNDAVQLERFRRKKLKPKGTDINHQLFNLLSEVFESNSSPDINPYYECSSTDDEIDEDSNFFSTVSGYHL